MSALPPKADIGGRQLDVRFVPKGYILQCSRYPLPAEPRITLQKLTGRKAELAIPFEPELHRRGYPACR
jgi:hypothetical protein